MTRAGIGLMTIGLSVIVLGLAFLGRDDGAVSGEASQVLGATSAVSPTAQPGSQPSLPDARLYFSAGGSIYSVRPDGTDLRRPVQGRRGPRDEHDLLREWASSPAISPDGKALAFVRDYDVWLAASDGSNQRLLVDAGDWTLNPDCINCASSGSLGASSLAWDDWGESLIYTVHRINGSGIRQTWVVDSRNGFPLIAGEGVEFAVATWREKSSSQGAPDSEAVRQQNVWVTAHFIDERDVGAGFAIDAMTKLATGVAATLHRDEVWLAYFKGDELRIVRTDGKHDRLVFDLAPLGGRDRHFASSECSRTDAETCSYRPPVINWGP